MLEKRGLSPIIAVVLLIILAILMSLIFFNWARSFTKEKEQKFGQPADIICDKTMFAAEIKQSNGEVVVTNIGNIPLYGIQLKEKNSGFLKNIDTKYFQQGLAPGETGIINFTSGFEIEREYLVIPVLLTETTSYKKPYLCDERSGRNAEVV